MKRARAIVSLLLAAAAFWALDNRHGAFPALGRLLDPFAGFWQNGGRLDRVPASIDLPGLHGEVRVAWDDRRVPHIFAADDHDLFLAQGYVAASLRLWQMDIQARATAGRLAEVVGPSALRQDIFNRRFGLPAAAAAAVRAFEADAATREALEAFAAGVNARIREIGRRRLPVEFKILDYRPEPWSPHKCALLLKAMAYALTSFNRDAAMTRLVEQGGRWPAALEGLFPACPPLVEPVIPHGTPFDLVPQPAGRESGVPAPRPGTPGRGGDGDSARPEDGRPGEGASGPVAMPALGPAARRTEPGLGSNNWAVAGRLTRSGHPILCNDMHLELSLPAVWYEVQLAAPGINVRGVAFPAAPLVVAGFNENVAWGFTNGTDDVLDWYRIVFRDDTRAEYFYDGAWRRAEVREERFKVRGGRDVVDRIVTTVHGPVVRWPGEPAFAAMDVPEGAALRWTGHDPSNEFAVLNALDRARDYDDYVAALEGWSSPSQNFAFAARDGTIAMWHNGRLPLRRPGQGRFVQNGADPADDWGGWVPHAQLPHVKDPACGFVSSANQAAVDAAYPCDLGRDFASYERGARINELLRAARDVTPEDMVRMQADVVDIRARAVVPRLAMLLGPAAATETEARAVEELRAWNFEARAASIGPSIFRELWNELERLTWDDEAGGAAGRMVRPGSQILVDLIVNEPRSAWFDDRTTPEREDLAAIAVRAFRAAVASLEARRGPFGPAWRWGVVKGTEVRHLGRIPGFGLKLDVDGAGQVINAISTVWAPSWRMVVELGPEVRAWGNYPGGQSGDPGSRFYADRVPDWAAGKSYELLFLRSADAADPRIVARTVLKGGR